MIFYSSDHPFIRDFLEAHKSVCSDVGFPDYQLFARYVPANQCLAREELPAHLLSGSEPCIKVWVQPVNGNARTLTPSDLDLIGARLPSLHAPRTHVTPVYFMPYDVSSNETPCRA